VNKWVGNVEGAKTVELMTSHAPRAALFQVVLADLAKGPREAAISISIADRTLAISFHSVLGIWTGEFRQTAVGPPKGCSRMRCARFHTPAAAALVIGRRAAEAGAWGALLLPDEVGAGAHWLQSALPTRGRCSRPVA
jgi:hypothetical protein